MAGSLRVLRTGGLDAACVTCALVHVEHGAVTAGLSHPARPNHAVRVSIDSRDPVVQDTDCT